VFPHVKGLEITQQKEENEAMTRTYHKRQAPRGIAQAQTEPKEGFKFLDASPRQPNGNALATTKFEYAFTALAQERAAELRENGLG
jgi:hypothetical protein